MSDVLRVGDRSPRVAEVRATLARLGLLPSFDGYVIDKEAQQFEEKDTFFDAALAEALQGFQQSRGFVPNGEISEATLKILRARIGPEDFGSRPGARVRIGKEPAVKAADRFLILDEVQPAGKKPMSGRAFLGGYRNWSPDGLEGP